MAPAAGPWGADLEETACPLCGHGERRTAYRFPPFAVVSCNSCGLFFLSPRPTESALLERYARDDYFAGADGGYDDYAAQEGALRATFRRFLERLREAGLTGGALLEVGCGYGWFLDEARGLFSSRHGTEFSPAAARAAAERADRVHRGGIEQVPAGSTFDCIVALQLIEHIPRPVPFLRALRGLLAPGGRLVLATPDMGSPWRRVLGRRWPSFKLPEHLLFFDEKSLGRLLSLAGFTGLRPLPYPHAFPLDLVLRKLGVRSARGLHGAQVWVPGTTVAVAARAQDAG